MSIAGGLLPSKQLPPRQLHHAYKDAGEGNFVILQDGMRLAAEFKSGNDVPEGFCVLNIEHGRETYEVGPVPVTVGEDTLIIPRGSDRIVPLSFVNALNDAVVTEYYQRDLMSPLSSRSTRRFNFQVKKWPKTGKHQGVAITKEDLENSMESHEVIELNQD